MLPWKACAAMEMQQIRYFLHLAQTLNFTRAAEACNVTQPALTRAIRALEQELGGDLIRREPRNAHLTELGRRMLPLLQQCFDSANSARSLARAVRSSDLAPLALGVMHGISMATLVPIVAELFRAFPGAQLRIRRGAGAEMLALLKEGTVDVAVASPLDGEWERLDTWRLFDDPFSVVVHRDHRLGRNNAIVPTDLAGERMLCLAGCEIRPQFEQALASWGVAAQHAHEVETDADLLALLCANAGVAMLPASADLADALRRLLLDGVALQRMVAVHAVAGRQRSPATGMLLTLLRAADWPEVSAA
jgi:DNA-binding transcriptional LysR family regulator